MGFDIDGIRYLFHAKEIGVDYRHTLMLGRQKLHISEKRLQDLLSESGYSQLHDTGKPLHAQKGDYAENFLGFIGASKVDSLDISSFESASIIHDMNQPVSTSLQKKFSAVIDGGFMEHVFDIRQAFQNAMNLVDVGGHYIGLTVTNNFCGHGFFQFSPELFFRIFSEENGYKLLEMVCYEANKGGNGPWFRVKDPAAMRARMMMTSGVPLYLSFTARRDADVPPFSSEPKQSDYSMMWKKEKTADLSSEVKQPASSLLTMLRLRVRRFIYAVCQRCGITALEWPKSDTEGPFLEQIDLKPKYQEPGKS